MANMMLGFRFFHVQDDETEGLEQDYNYQGVRIRALPGYDKEMPYNYAKQYEINPDNIVVLVLNGDLSDKELRILNDIKNLGGERLKRVFIVRHKVDKEEMDAAFEAEQNRTDMRTVLNGKKSAIERKIRRQLREKNFSDNFCSQVPILFTSARMEPWDSIKNLYEQINTMVNTDNRNWERFSGEYRSTRDIYYDALRVLAPPYDNDNFIEAVDIAIGRFGLEGSVLREAADFAATTLKQRYTNTNHADLYKGLEVIISQVTMATQCIAAEGGRARPSRDPDSTYIYRPCHSCHRFRGC